MGFFFFFLVLNEKGGHRYEFIDTMLRDVMAGPAQAFQRPKEKSSNGAFMLSLK